MKRTSRPDSVSNRNTIIMGNFAKSKVGTTANIFDGLDFPHKISGKEFNSPEEYYMWQHGWHTYENYEIPYRRLRDIFGPNTYSECGATVAKFQSWGLIGDTKYVLNGITGALEKIPEFNENFNDIKDFIIVAQPHYDEKSKKIRCTYILRFHDDYDPNNDYISDPHIQSILRQASTVWGVKPATVTQPLLPYDLERLCNEEPEFKRLDLDPNLEGDILFIRDPITERKRALGRKVVLIEEKIEVVKRNLEIFYQNEKRESHKNKTLEGLLNRLEFLCGDPIFFGRYREWNKNERSEYVGLLLDGALATTEIEIFPSGTIIGAPYFLINFESDKEGGTLKSLFYSLKFKFEKEKVSKKSLLEAISQVSQENKEKIEAFNKLEEYADNLEDMVEERTKELRETQDKLIEVEKRSLEHRITGGFAHEMRNALAGAQLEFKTILNYKEQGFSATDAIKQATTHLFETIERYHQKYNIPREDIAKEAIPYIKQISTTLSELSRTMEGVHHDLERGLSITNVIREYAKMSEFKPGDTPVDLVPLLKGYEKRYRQDFERIGIRYLVEGVGEAIVKAEELHLDSIFDNIIRNAKDALEDYDATGEKEIKVTVETKDAEDGKNLDIKISDNGLGISEDNLQEIFEPFFSTKPTSGTGLGLGIVKRLVQLYGGQIDVESKENEGARFTVSLPAYQQ